MGNKRRGGSKPRFSPNETVMHLTDDFVKDLEIPALPDKVPARLSDAIRRRVQAYLFYLKEARGERYVPAMEVRLIRDAQRAVLTAFELNLSEREVMYAEFRQAVEALGYERAEAGYRKIR